MDILFSEKRGTALIPAPVATMERLVAKLVPEVGELLRIIEELQVEGVFAMVNPNTLRYLGRRKASGKEPKRVFMNRLGELQQGPAVVSFVFNPFSWTTLAVVGTLSEREVIALMQSRSREVIEWKVRAKLADRLGMLCAQASMGALAFGHIAEECKNAAQKIQEERYWNILRESGVAKNRLLKLLHVDLKRDEAVFQRRTKRGRWTYVAYGNGRVTREFLDDKFPF